jgi:preprotein translocase subunit SecG
VIYALYFVHVLVSLFLILVVLLQQGRGADLSVFGGGATMTAFGARGAATLLHKLTVASFTIFILTTMSIALVQGARRQGSVMSGAETAPIEAPAATPATPETAPPEAPQETPPPPGETP